jgi:hypothetical protein
MSRGQTTCGNILKELFPHNRFTENHRPDWLKNPETGCNLELDFYNNPLNIGLEFNGKQHYFIDLIEQQRRDNIKKQLCKQNNLFLITIPFCVENKKYYIYSYLRYGIMHGYIQCDQNVLNKIDTYFNEMSK